MGNTLDQARAGMSLIERRVFSSVALALGHTKESLEGDGDAVVRLRKVAVEVGRTVDKEIAEQVGELLFDAAHEHCGDEGCTGGGAPWYDTVAARLVDPYGPLAAIAQVQQMNAEDVGSPTADEANDAAAWLGLLTQHTRLIRRAPDNGELRRRLVCAGAVLAEWIAALDKPEPADQGSDHTNE